MLGVSWCKADVPGVVAGWRLSSREPLPELCEKDMCPSPCGVQACSSRTFSGTCSLRPEPVSPEAFALHWSEFAHGEQLDLPRRGSLYKDLRFEKQVTGSGKWQLEKTSVLKRWQP